ncbi:cytochrome c oxidase subunit II [Dongia sp.]|uniref:cytochrome c oxidase subunit II n=1 Tax=Dongia sp. TaxID=1977262 RepID=UPI0035B1E211
MFLKQMFGRVAAKATGLMTLAGSAAMAASAPLQNAWAQEVLGAPKPMQLGLQEPATSIAVDLNHFHNWVLMPIITVITVFVMLLLLWVMIRYNAKRNPVPSKTTHNTLIEVLWTVIPILILIGISVPSFKLLYKQLDLPQTDLTIRAIGKQWYWSYEYPDNGNFTFDANMVPTDQLQPGQLRLLETDNEVVLPVGKNIRIQITAADVIHAWTVPAFGIKHDAVPGRVNESWFNIDKPGIYYGQCSELCGTAHAFMPIKIRAVTQAEYDAWVAEAQTKFARIDGTPVDAEGTHVAAAETAAVPAN